MPEFKDHFSKQSAEYAKFRPKYPQELFAFLSSLCAQNELAWDCGAGNGQAALGLSPFFRKVIATEPSSEQLKNSFSLENVEYRLEKAEETSLADHSVDLLCIANALHWFDFEAFYPEVKRILKKGGIIAAWCYRIPKIAPEIDRLLQEFHDGQIDVYWRPENRLVDQAYKTIPFPFEVIGSPEFSYRKSLNLDEVLAYLNTWSATQRFIEEHGYNPTIALRESLLEFWEDPSQEKTLIWDLPLLVGRM